MPPYVLFFIIPFTILYGRMTERQIIGGLFFLPVIYPFAYGLFWLVVPNFISAVSIKLTNHAQWTFIAIVIPAAYAVIFLSGNVVRKLISGEIDTHGHRIAVVLSADVKCYQQYDEGGQDDLVERLNKSQEEFAQTITKYRGLITNLAVDGILAEFRSVSKVINCAVEFHNH